MAGSFQPLNPAPVSDRALPTCKGGPENGGSYVQPPWPDGFGGTAPVRCGGYGVGPHVWIEGGSHLHACKVCNQAGDDCEACYGEGYDENDTPCAGCCGAGVVPLDTLDSIDAEE